MINKNQISKAIKNNLNRIFLILILVMFFFITFKGNFAQAYNTKSAKILINADSGEILYEENAEERLEIASTTKILTAICAIENSDILALRKVPRNAVGIEGSSIYLRENDEYRVLDLIYGLMLRSGNDAAVALAILTSGSVEKFCDLMNKTAQNAGAKNSNFVNPNGLHDDNHYSSARDMAFITAYAMKCPIFAEIVNTKVHKCKKNDGENVVFYNKNKLLSNYEYATGVKTGYTTHSGRCLVSSAEKDGIKLIAVVLNVYDTYGESKKLFEEGFEKVAESL